MKLKTSRPRSFLIIVLCSLVAYVLYYQFQAYKAVGDYTKAVSQANLSWQQASSPSPTPEPKNDIDSQSNAEEGKITLYQDEYLAFEVPNSLRLLDNSDDFTAMHLKYVNIRSVNCDFPEIWYGVRTVKQAGSKLAQENPYGPADQVARIEVINGITVGVRIQPVGDGSGGYSPSVTVDFLSKSKKYHYYLSAFSGCNDSAQETYARDLKPILNSIKRLE